MKKFTIIFKALENKKGIKTFFISAIIISLVYLLFSILTSLLATKPWPKVNLIDLILFAGMKAFSMFTTLDWIILVLFPLFGGLLFANYSYWKCKTNKLSKAGLTGGLFAAICPACLLPIIGAYSFVAFLTKIIIYIKIGALAMIIVATYFVASRQTKCSVPK